VGISAPLRAGPFYTGSGIGVSGATSVSVPYTYPVALDGVGYMIDTVLAQEWKHQTVPLLRAQSDDTREPSGASLNPDGLWRRPRASWHKGAGQTHSDRIDSNEFRFAESRGMDIWTRYLLTLLPAVDQKHTTSATNLKLVVANDRLFLVDGAAVTYTTDITVGAPTWTACTGEPGGTILDMATDGQTVWITDGTDIFDAVSTAAPPDFAVAWSASDADVLGFCKGRLVSGDNSTGTLATYNAAGVATAIPVSGVLPTTWTWVGFAGGTGNSVIYVAGFAGDKSTIYRIGIREDGTGLDPAIPCGELPDGEIVRSIGTYLGFVLIGTDNGVRFATPGQSGDLTVGALLLTNTPCRCFEGQGPHVWFGWDAFTDSVASLGYTGLGRLSLEEFSSAERLAPAYATDLMDAATGQTSSVVTFQDVRVWTNEGTGRGVFAQEVTPVGSGYLTEGITDFGFSGNKTVVDFEYTYIIPTGGQIGFDLEADESGTWLTIGDLTDVGKGTSRFSTGNVLASRFDLLVTLTAGGATAPSLTSYTLKSTPAVEGTNKIQVPLLLNERVDPDGGLIDRSVRDDRNQLVGLWESRQPITYQELSRVHTVVVEDLTWIPRLRADDVTGFEVDGTMIVSMKEL
jgi:hypothetical protein